MMSAKNKLKASKTATPIPLTQQGKYRWSFEYKNGKVMDKYNSDGTKNVYCSREAGTVKVHAPIDNVQTAAFTDEKGNVAALIDVPDGAKVFQRRRVRDINYYNRFHDATQKIGGCLISGRWVPEHTATKKVPEYTYGEVWLIGWRKREADSTVSLQFKAVYPDGKVEEYTKWNLKPWLYEPEWFTDEQV